MSNSLAPVIKQQFNLNGNPVSGGKLYAYLAGTSTPTTTWKDQSNSNPNQFPITLNSNGECDLWLDQTISYKFKLCTSTNVELWTVNNVKVASSSGGSVDWSNITNKPTTVEGYGITDAFIVSAGIATNGFIIANPSDTGGLNEIVISATNGSTLSIATNGIAGYVGVTGQTWYFQNNLIKLSDPGLTLTMHPNQISMQSNSGQNANISYSGTDTVFDLYDAAAANHSRLSSKDLTFNGKSINDTFVSLTSAQTISGTKTFNNPIILTSAAIITSATPGAIQFDGYNFFITVNDYSLIGSFTDPADGKVYKTITIGTQTWFAENYRNTTWGYSVSAGQDAIFGRFYDRDTISVNAPSGWHLPTVAEWNILIAYAGGMSVAGGTLKANSNLWTPNTGTDSFNFSAIPAGYDNLGSIAGINTFALFWAADGTYQALNMTTGNTLVWGTANSNYYLTTRFIKN